MSGTAINKKELNQCAIYTHAEHATRAGVKYQKIIHLRHMEYKAASPSKKESILREIRKECFCFFYKSSHPPWTPLNEQEVMKKIRRSLCRCEKPTMFSESKPPKPPQDMLSSPAMLSSPPSIVGGTAINKKELNQCAIYACAEHATHAGVKYKKIILLRHMEYKAASPSKKESILREIRKECFGFFYKSSHPPWTVLNEREVMQKIRKSLCRRKELPPATLFSKSKSRKPTQNGQSSPAV
jgi:hypothetical protein